MKDFFAALAGTALIFGTGDSDLNNTDRLHKKFKRKLEEISLWVNSHSNVNLEKRTICMLETKEGQDVIRHAIMSEANVLLSNFGFEFDFPLDSSEIREEKEWALALYLALYGAAPSWQGQIGFSINTGLAMRRAMAQVQFFKKSNVECTLLEKEIRESSWHLIDGNNSVLYTKRREAAVRRMKMDVDYLLLRKRFVSLEEHTDPNNLVDDELERALTKMMGIEEDIKRLSLKYRYIWENNSIRPFDPMATLRTCEKSFYQKWTSIFEMAERGKVPSWQLNWSPTSRADYLCLVEQLRIFKIYGHDPGWLLLALPDDMPTEHNTLDSILFKKS